MKAWYIYEYPSRTYLVIEAKNRDEAILKAELTLGHRNFGICPKMEGV